MRAVRSLLLSLAAAAAVVQAHRGGGRPHHPSMHDHMPNHGRHGHHHGHHDEPAEPKGDGLVDYLNEQFQHSADVLQHFLGLGAPVDEGVRVIVVTEEDDAETPSGLTVEEQRMACRTALTRLHEQDELKETGNELASQLHASLRSAFQLVSVHYLDETSCDDLETPSLVDECNRFVNMEEQIRAYLYEGKSDAEVCELLAIAPIVEDEGVYELEDCSGEGQVAGQLSCTMCQRFVQMVDQALADQVQQVEQVRQIIGDLCDAMSADSMCHVFLKHYDEVVDWLKHGTEPLVVCTWLSMCTPSPSPTPVLAQSLDTSVEVFDDDKDHACFFCTRVAEVVDRVNHTSPDKLPVVKTILDNVCQLTPADCKCDDIDKDFDKLVDLIKQGNHPHKACKGLGYCKKHPHLAIGSPESAELVENQLVPLHDNACLYCDVATTLLEILLQEQPDQVDLIRTYADMVCDMLGEENQCHTYVKQLDSVIDALKKGTHPREICNSLKYCTAAIAHAQEEKALVVATEEGHHRNHACKFCVRSAAIIHHVNHTSPDKLPIVKNILTNVCQLVPADCKCDVVLQNFDKIVDLEKEGKRPFEVCETVGVCNKTDTVQQDEDLTAEEAMKGLVVSSGLEFGNETNCAYCTFATTIIRVAIVQYGDEIAQIRAYADMLCDMLGADSGCHAYVSQLDTVLDLIKEGKSSHAICAELKYCAAYGNTIAMNEDEDDDEMGVVPIDGHRRHGCKFCVRVALFVRHVNATAPDKLPIVKTILDNVCKLAPADCKCDLIDKNFDKIVELTQNKTCPIKICKSIGACNRSSTLMEELVDSEPFEDTVLALATAGNLEASNSGVNCFLCDYVTALLQVALEQDANKTGQVRQMADAFCALLGEESGCHQYVDKLDFVLDSLKNGTHPRAICMSLKYCPADVPSVPLALPVPSDVSNDFDPSVVLAIEDAMVETVDPCFFCTQVTTVIEVVLKQNPSELDTIRQITDMVCGMLPSDNKCHEYVRDFDTVVDGLKKGQDAKTICHDLKYCKATSVIAEKRQAIVDSVENKGSSTCAYCTGLATVLKYALVQDAEQVKQLREAAGIVCELLPADDKCHQDLKLFDVAVKELEAGKQPHEVCQDLKYCTDTDSSSSLGVWDMLRFVDTDTAPSKCSSCKQNTLLLASMVSQPDRLATFEDELESVCRLIPESDECQLLLNHKDAIVTGLINGETVDSICAGINVCDSSNDIVDSDKTFSVGCLFCEYTAGLLKLAGNNEKELRLARTTLQTMCTILPPSAHCDALSSKFDDLVALLQTGKSPGEACRAIELCSPAAAKALAKEEEVDDNVAVALALAQAQAAVGNVMEIQ